MEHLPFFEYFFPVISSISLILGLFGVFIISIGSAKSAWEYIKNNDNSFQKIRTLLRVFDLKFTLEIMFYNWVYKLVVVWFFSVLQA